MVSFDEKVAEKQKLEGTAVFLHLSLAVLVGVQLLHPVGVAEGVQGVLARRHAGADHRDHTGSRLRVEDDALR